MARQRIAVLTNRNLLLTGITAILKEHSEFEILEIESTDADLGSRLSCLMPAVIIVDCADGGLAGRRSLWSLIQENPGITVVAVGSDQSKIEAYTQHHVVHGRAEDLLDLIKAGGLPDAKGS